LYKHGFQSGSSSSTPFTSYQYFLGEPQEEALADTLFDLHLSHLGSSQYPENFSRNTMTGNANEPITYTRRTQSRQLN
jgi:hypothetical protein